QARCVFVPAVDWPGNVLHDADLAENFLSVNLDLTRSHFRADQLLDRTPVFAGATAHRRLAHSDLAGARRAGVRIFLGDVELLRLSQMDLPHPGPGLPADFRNAAAGLRRLHPLWLGVVCAYEFCPASEHSIWRIRPAVALKQSAGVVRRFGCVIARPGLSRC